ncbi:MAG: RNA-binding domain-containing protein [Thermosphaera sp.]
MQYRYVEISVIIHSTESVDAVLGILRSAFGDIPIVVEIYEGHYGNPIYLATSYLENCDYVLKKLCEQFGGNIPASPGDGVYYLRLDKQALAAGRFVAANHDDVVRLKIRVKNGLCD